MRLHGNPTAWYLFLATTHTKGDTSDIAIVQPTEHPRTSPAGIEGMTTRASISLLRTSAVVFCLASIVANGALEAWKNYVGKDEEDRAGLGRAELLH